MTHDMAGDWDEAFPVPDDPARTLVLVFGCSRSLRSDPEPLGELRRGFPGSVLAGCSTAGEIVDASVRDGSLVAAVVEFDSTGLRASAAPCPADEDSFAAGRRLGEGLRAPDLAAVLLLSSGLRVNGSELVRGLTGALPPEVPVTGGLAGDDDRFEHTWVLVDGKPTEGFVTAVGFYGSSVDYRHGSQGGWDMFGPERVITRSDGNVLYELDGRPALELYRQYLGDLADDLPASGLLFPLSVRASADDPFVVRTILGIDEADRAMVFAGDVPQGHLAQLMQATTDRLVGGAEAAAMQTGITADRPVLAVAVSCVGRRLVLGERTEEETEATFAHFPAGSRQVGFYSYGEVSPSVDGAGDLHNQTMTLTTISEDP
jgi:hypothetical protein